MPTNINELRLSALGPHVNNPPTTEEGFFFPVNSNNQLNGGLYFPEDTSLELISQGNKQIIRTTITTYELFLGIIRIPKTHTVDIELDYEGKTTKIVNKSDNTIIDSYNSLPNGTIFVNGAIASIKGTVNKNAKLSIGALNNITINNHIQYEENPRTKANATNILALLTERGNFIVPNTGTPNNIKIDATLIAINGSLMVPNICNTGDKGTMTIYGGLIAKHFDYVGMFNNCNYNQIHGYRRHVIYDPRASDPDKAPGGLPKTSALKWDTYRDDGANSLDLVVWKNTAN